MLLHVLILPSWYPTKLNPINGCFFREQAKALAKVGMRVGVISPSAVSMRNLDLWRKLRKFPEHYTDGDIDTYQKVFLNTFPRMPFLQTKQFLSIGLKMFRRYIDENGKPDLIHAHAAIMGGRLALEISRRYDIPYVITEHSTGFARNIYKKKQLEIAKEAYRFAKARIAVSRPFGQLLERMFPDAFTEWIEVPNIVMPEFSPPESIEEKSRFETQEHFIFLNLGIMTPKKGQRDLLRSFANAFQGDSRVRLRIGGDGPLRAELRQLAEELEILSQIDFLGSLDREQVVEEMRHCDAFVLSSHFETFGVVLIEALACGKPVIATACGGPESIVNDGNGILVPPGDITALSKALQSIITNYKTFNPEEIARDCHDRFGAESVAVRLQKIYEKVLTKS